MNKIAPYLKAVVGFLTPGVVALGFAIQDGSPGNSAITQAEWVAALVACFMTGGAVFTVKNSGPQHRADD